MDDNDFMCWIYNFSTRLFGLRDVCLMNLLGGWIFNIHKAVLPMDN